MQPSDSLISITVLGKMLFGLSIVLGIMGILILLVRYLQKQKISLTGEEDILKVIQTNHLGAKKKLVILSWKNTQYLVGLTPSGGFLIDKKPMTPSDENMAQKKGFPKNV